MGENGGGVREDGDELLGEREEENGVEVMEEAAAENQGMSLCVRARVCICG